MSEQISINEEIEAATGVPTPPDTLPIKMPIKTRTKPGEHRLLVTLDEASYDAVVKSADGRPINVWLSLLINRNLHMILPVKRELGSKE